MSALRLLAAVAAAWVLAIAAQATLAQSPGPVRMEPFYPTLSPWLKLYATNTGPLDNYHTFVRPELQMREMVQRQSVTNARQAAGMWQLQGELDDLHKQKAVRPTGTGSVFMNYSHYYDSRSTQARFGK